MTTDDCSRAWAAALGAAMLGLGLGVGVAEAQPATSRAAATAAARPLSEADSKAGEELQAAQTRLDVAGARVMAASPDGRRRVAETIARSLGVPDKAVSELRARRVSYGEATVTLAVSQHLLRRERGLTQAQAIERIAALRRSHGWGVVGRDLGVRLGDVVGDVKKVDAQLAKLDSTRTARVPGPARPVR
jgi:hypothetical protein